MKRALISMLFAVVAAGSAHALDIESMTDEERSIFREEIRAYLLDNPEVLMEAIGVLEQRREQEAANLDVDLLAQNRDDIFDDGYSFVGGNPDGDVTVVEFLDYRCGFCKRAFPAIQELLATDGNIRLIVKEFPILGEESALASRYAIAAKEVAGDAAYKDIHDLLMLHNGSVSAGFLARTSRELGLDHGAIAEQMESPEVESIISTNRALAQRLQIQGTPSFIMGENFVRGFVELDQMRAIVDQIRAEQG
ncbi:DsbA family protein [Rhodobacteraceae bacterium]|nr:DsbA family protein [Paracoccaceae bacterium]